MMMMMMMMISIQGSWVESLGSGLGGSWVESPKPVFHFPTVPGEETVKATLDTDCIHI